jgi:acetyl-CoA carboxylase beta subunit
LIKAIGDRRQFKASDPLKFKDSKRYKDRISQAQKQSNETDARLS